MNGAKQFRNVKVFLLGNVYNLIKHILYHVEQGENLIDAFGKSQLKITKFLSHLMFENQSEGSKFLHLIAYKDIENPFSFFFDKYLRDKKVRTTQSIIAVLRAIISNKDRAPQLIECIDFGEAEISSSIYPLVNLLPRKYWQIFVNKLNERYWGMGIEGFDIAALLRGINRPFPKFNNHKLIRVREISYSPEVVPSFSEFSITDTGSVEVIPDHLYLQTDDPQENSNMYVTTGGFFITNINLDFEKIILIIPYCSGFETVANASSKIIELIKIMDVATGNTTLNMLDYYSGACYSITYVND